MRTVEELFAEVVSFLVLASIIAGIFAVIGNPWESGVFDYDGTASQSL